jgi:hypothetical protein
MHGSVMEFVGSIKKKFPNRFSSGCRVVEFGSRNINGSPRKMFSNPNEYVGIDFHGGKDVDVVGVAHEWKPPRAEYDVVVSTEMLEHDPFWEKTLTHAAGLLASGGVLVFTCAAPCRQAHHLEDSPVSGYYGNRSTEEVLEVLSKACKWKELDAKYSRNNLDLMFWGEKA